MALLSRIVRAFLARVFNPLHRGSAFRRASALRGRSTHSRLSRRQIGGASECDPALRPSAATILLLLAGMLTAGAQVTREYDLKAAFLFNFAQFVEWPATAFGSSDAPFTIGVLGADPFGTALDDVVRNEKVNGRQLIVLRYRSVEEIKGCQILFISESESPNAEQVVMALKGRNVLTVGDTDKIASSGGVIRFFPEKNRLRLRINVNAAKREKLTISSKLLRAAEIVNTGGTH